MNAIVRPQVLLIFPVELRTAGFVVGQHKVLLLRLSWRRGCNGIVGFKLLELASNDLAFLAFVDNGRSSRVDGTIRGRAAMVVVVVPVVVINRGGSVLDLVEV